MNDLGLMVASYKRGVVRVRLYRAGRRYTMVADHLLEDRMHGVMIVPNPADTPARQDAVARELSTALAEALGSLSFWPSDEQFDRSFRPHLRPTGVHE